MRITPSFPLVALALAFVGCVSTPSGMLDGGPGDAADAFVTPPVDGGPIIGCDPLTHAECGAGERCGWVRLGEGLEESRCVPAGTVDEGDACDPLTQTACPSGQGCYLSTESPISVAFGCAPAGSIAVGETVTGKDHVSSCVPGARPMRGPDGWLRCAAHCRPVETHSAAIAGESGEAPFRCEDVGGSASDACLFEWRFTWGGYDPRLNELGVCVPDGFLTSPSCTTVPNTDTDGDGVPQHQELGCAPRPAP